MLTLDELLVENRELRRVLHDSAPAPGDVGSRATLFVWAVVGLSTLAVIAMVTLAIVKPDNTSTGTMVLGLLLPLITAFLGAALQQVHLAVNSRLSELLVLTAKSSKAEGQLAQRNETAGNAPLARTSEPVQVEVMNTPLVVTQT